MNVVDLWTGRSASALRAALRMSTEAVANRLGTGVRIRSELGRETDDGAVTGNAGHCVHVAAVTFNQADVGCGQRPYGLLVAARVDDVEALIEAT